MTKTPRFEGKVALITGGGTSIGAPAAMRIADEGAHVVLFGRRETPLKAIADACDSLAVVGDTTSLDDLENAVHCARERFGALDILVASAEIELFGSVGSLTLGAQSRFSAQAAAG